MTGAYVQVIPTADTIAKVRAMLRGIDLPFFLNRELHVTVIYAPKVLGGSDSVVEKGEAMCESGPFPGFIEHFETWQDHKDRTILVARIRSAAIGARHEFWKGQGLLHSYPDYNCHMTLTDPIEDPAQRSTLESTVAMLNAVYANTDVEFRHETIEELEPKVPVVAADASKTKSKKKRAFPGLPTVNLGPLPPPPVNAPILDAEEEQSVKDFGFNIHSHKRVLDGL